MILRWLLAAVHLVALGVGAGAIMNRSRAFASPLDGPSLKRLFQADTLWGVAALLWVSTGLWRLFGGTEKPPGYYMSSDAFWVKMGCFAAILVLEAWPMMTLIRWRAQLRRGEAPDTSRALLFSRISRLQLLLVIAMVFAATAMARGVGY
jgi:putative membrane protein